MYDLKVFEVEDLMELKNVPKVCKAVARLCRLVRFSISSWWWRWSCLLDTRYKNYLVCRILALWIIKYQQDMKDSLVHRQLLTARMKTWEALLVESRPSVRRLAFNLCESCLKTIPKWSQSWHPGLLLRFFLCVVIWSIFVVGHLEDWCSAFHFLVVQPLIQSCPESSFILILNPYYLLFCLVWPSNV